MKVQWTQVLAGFAAGVLLTAGLGLWKARQHRRPDPERREAHLLRVFNRRLDLAPEQSEKVRAILKANRPRFEALREDGRKRFDEVRASVRAEIRAVLTPGQQARFDALEAGWERRHRFRGPPPP